jgi:hypothetical protein
MNPAKTGHLRRAKTGQLRRVGSLVMDRTQEQPANVRLGRHIGHDQGFETKTRSAFTLTA